MPKINVYLKDDLVEWMREQELSPSRELQKRLSDIRNGAPTADGSDKPAATRYKRRTLKDRPVLTLKEGTIVVGYDENGRLLVLEPT